MTNDPRIANSELPPSVRRARKRQVMLAVAGMGAFLLALVGGAVESPTLAWTGIAGFLACLAGLMVVGVMTWRVR